MPRISRRSNRADVLILCALPEELAAVTALAAAHGVWEPKKDATGYPYYIADFADLSGGGMRIAAARAADMGSTDAAAVAATLSQELKPRCLAMCGICAGRRDKVFLGDVIVADRLFRYDGGKLMRLRGRRTRTRSERVLEDIQTYNLAKDWKVEAEAYGRLWAATAARVQRPLSLVYQERWLLDQLARHAREGGLSPQNSPERKAQCPRWLEAVELARTKGYISQIGLQLCDDGTTHLEELRLKYLDGFPPPDPPFTVHVGALGTGEKVIVDAELFQRLEDVERRILGIDMESQAIGVVAAYARIKHAIVVKAVQDYADPDKDDAFRSFAAEVSAGFLVDFLRAHLPPAHGVHSAKSLARARHGAGKSEIGPSPGAGFYSDHYISRPVEERDLLIEFDRRKPVVIFGPLGFGKTWFLKRTYQMLMEGRSGCRLVKLSAATLDAPATLDEFLRLLADAIVSAVGGEALWVESAWSGMGGAKAKLERLMETRILPRLPETLVLGIDQVDGLMSLPYCKDFFYLLNAWCERSGEQPWDSFRLIMTISTLPSRLRFRNSPFNKATNISLREFDKTQLGQLAATYGCQASAAELELLKRETAGHPLLAGIVFYEISQRSGELAQVLADSRLFSSYLERLRDELAGQDSLREAWRAVRRTPGTRVPADLSEDLLRCGLVEQRGQRLWPRCSLLERYPGW